MPLHCLIPKDRWIFFNLKHQLPKKKIQDTMDTDEGREHRGEIPKETNKDEPKKKKVFNF